MTVVGLVVLGGAGPAAAGPGGGAAPPVNSEETAPPLPQNPTVPPPVAPPPSGPLVASTKTPIWRGVIQGSYARPWSRAERGRVLDYIAEHDFNAYFHAPKDDPYQRTNWRVPWPREVMRQYLRELRSLRKKGVEWIPSLSPGKHTRPGPPISGRRPDTPICFSCPGEIDVLMRKLDPFLRARARTFLLSLDDAGTEFFHQQDMVAYGGNDDRAYGVANADLLNRLEAALKKRNPKARLFAVPAHYHGVRDTPYLLALRERLSPTIELMWTGSGSRCCGSSRFSDASAQAYASYVNRFPVVWDNWLNNDIGRTEYLRISLGPYIRPASSVRVTRGFVINTMNEPDLNLLPLGTASEYFRNPRGYKPYRDWLKVAKELAPEKYFEHFRAFAETNYSTKLTQSEDAPTFVARRRRFLVSYQQGADWVGARDALMEELQLAHDAGRVLRRSRDLRYFVRQARRFLGSARRAALAGMAAVELLEAERPRIELDGEEDTFEGTVAPPDPAVAAQARELMQARARIISREKFTTYGNRRPFVGTELRPLRNEMDIFLYHAFVIDSQWQPNADLASGGVELRLDGRLVQTDVDGAFELDAKACGKDLLATDAAGGTTQLTVPEDAEPCVRAREREQRARERERRTRERSGEGTGEPARAARSS